MQIHIAQEETKFGLDEVELEEVMKELTKNETLLQNVQIDGLMGMASFSDDVQKVKGEMKYLKALFDKYKPLSSTNCFSIRVLVARTSWPRNGGGSKNTRF